MGGGRAILAAVIGLTPGLPALPVRAVPPLAETFACCAGRLTAAVEHRWLFGHDPEAGERGRAAVLALRDAAPVPEDAGAALAARVEARAAMAALVSAAAFARDFARRADAAARAHALRAQCAALLLRPEGA